MYSRPSMYNEEKSVPLLCACKCASKYMFSFIYQCICIEVYFQSSQVTFWNMELP